MRGLGLDGGIFAEITTIANTVETIVERHPDLNLGDTQTMVNFLRDPNTHRLFRGVAKGGNSFADGFRRTSHPATLPWWEDREKPILNTSGAIPHITRDVREAAHASREINETLLDHPLSPSERDITNSYGLTDGSPKRFSSGCPTKHLLFQTNIPNLVTNQLTLSPDQADTLIGLTNPPVIQKFADSIYVIRRDSYAETSRLLATILELVA